MNVNALDDTQSSSPLEVIQAIAKQRDENLIDHERRQNARHRWDVQMTVELMEGAKRLSKRKITVTTTDLSTGGFAFVHSQYIYPDTLILAQFDALPNRPTLTGRIRSCEKIHGLYHRVGVQFIQKA